MPQHILFIDDEPPHSVRAPAHAPPPPRGMDMAFVGGGVEALERLTQTPFDVVNV